MFPPIAATIDISRSRHSDQLHRRRLHLRFFRDRDIAGSLFHRTRGETVTHEGRSGEGPRENYEGPDAEALLGDAHLNNLGLRIDRGRGILGEIEHRAYVHRRQLLLLRNGGFDPYH